MLKHDKRRTVRVSCCLPVRIRSHSGWLEVRIVDVSRTGVRLSIPDDQVGLPQDATLLETARRLGGMLPEHLDAEFDEEGRVRRRLRVVRIGKRRGGQKEVELGCLLDVPLSDVDAVSLDLVLPREGESWEQAERRAATQRQSEGAATEEAPTNGKAATSLGALDAFDE